MASATARQFNVAFKKVFAPRLSARGFTGRLPDFRRIDDRGVSLLFAQKARAGGGVRLELGYAPRWLFEASVLHGSEHDVVLVSLHDGNLRHTLSSDFEHYDAVPAEEIDDWVGALADRFEAEIAWYARTAITTTLVRRAEPSFDALLSIAPVQQAWAVGWLLEQNAASRCEDFLRRMLTEGRDAKLRASWVLAKAGDAAAHAHLVELLDDPDLTTETSHTPGLSIRAAQALADVHGWPFAWARSSVGVIKDRVAREG